MSANVSILAICIFNGVQDEKKELTPEELEEAEKSDTLLLVLSLTSPTSNSQHTQTHAQDGALYLHSTVSFMLLCTMKTFCRMWGFPNSRSCSIDMIFLFYFFVADIFACRPLKLLLIWWSESGRWGLVSIRSSYWFQPTICSSSSEVLVSDRTTRATRC